MDNAARTKRRKPDRTFPAWVAVVVLLALCLLTHLPQLLSPRLLLDGDECILGLMAKHTLQGREFPVFFPGQNYGLSTFEALAGAASFFVLGVGALPLKLAMLALWSVGIVFCYLTLALLLGRSRGFWTTLLFVFIPAWAVWSMKARGGYVTAFALTAVIVYAAVRTRHKPAGLAWLFVGVLTALLRFAQPLWLPGVLAFVLYFLFKRRKIVDGLVWLAGFGAAVVLVRLLAGDVLTVLGPHALDWSRGVWKSLAAVPQKIFVNMTGSYYLASAIKPGWATTFAAAVWTALIPAGMAVHLVRIVKKRIDVFSLILFCSALLSVAGAVLPVEEYGPRFLLATSQFLVFWVAVEIAKGLSRAGPSRKAAGLLLAVLVAAGVFSLFEFRNFSFTGDKSRKTTSEAERLTALIDHLKTNGIRQTFTLQQLFQWQVMFYSNEAVASRSVHGRERYFDYVQDVDQAFVQGRKTALIGYALYSQPVTELEIKVENFARVGEDFFVYTDPDRRLLRKLHFEFR